ncbi:MurR/RpiR family transcriptional regulator [Agromyces ramosus]|uniref:DNA-binding MurR/RpiR family transcriptional regulator n=1 Tax=Agromyces ramosus TaxID=33879 RepID=A0ABU0R5R1_9MICO|nr:MurR/RpiR family transcriptional regulator [Agromyces ramosus]MDQ0893419.1 DNA-binding MurR/RpiR family transcriptional regulator [Agromyces ramosus]
MTTNVLSEVQQALPRLSSSEARVAEAIIADPTLVVDLTITDLARVCGTSLSTVARFCQTLGYSGYREFRMEVATAISREAAGRDRFGLADSHINTDDAAADVVAKIAFHEVLAIEQTVDGLDTAVLDGAVGAIVGAAHIDLYGFGASGLTAQDLQQKLSRIGISAFCSVDIHLALVSAALRKPTDVAIAISHSGLTAETNHALEVARDAGATTIVITNSPESPIAELAEFVLPTRARESTYRMGAMSSRIAQLALVDFLFVRVAQRRHDDVAAPLRRTYEVTASHRIPSRRRPPADDRGPAAD